eukprot:TRINITY_DN13051_c0_g1_i24.p4 TRINITY_DN13051_c0_g1~~TRINITY_DN13051_c0_g1_i24.p4  ORF type:complete len:119 (-),score=20.71 TRINITY_DN13051_c0_g1_i24:920-1276(-)
MEIEEAKLADAFSNAQKLCEGFMNDENCSEQHYSKATNLLDAIAKSVKSQAIFSPNEEFAEIKTENFKFLLLPFYLADVHGRFMKERKDSVKKSNVILQFYTRNTTRNSSSCCSTTTF